MIQIQSKSWVYFMKGSLLVTPQTGCLMHSGPCCLLFSVQPRLWTLSHLRSSSVHIVLFAELAPAPLGHTDQCLPCPDLEVISQGYLSFVLVLCGLPFLTSKKKDIMCLTGWVTLAHRTCLPREHPVGVHLA